MVAIGETDAGAAAISVSASLFSSSPAVLVAPAGDGPAQLLGASAAVLLGVPLLVSPDLGPGLSPDTGTPVATEVKRLGATAVITIGDVPGAQTLAGPGSRVIALDEVPEDVRAALSESLGSTGTHAPAITALGQNETAVAAVAAMSADTPTVLFLEEPPTPDRSASPPAASPTAASPRVVSPTVASPGASAPPTPRPVIPRLRPASAVPGTIALAGDSPEHLAAVATARAAGVPVTVLQSGEVDPLTSAAIMTALTVSAPQHVLALGGVFADDSALEWKLAVAKSGRQLPGGGGSWFPSHTLVAIYGTPGTGALGILGEQNVTKSVARAKEYASPFEPLTKTAVVPTFEIIATVAAGSAGRDGNYSNEMDIDTLQKWAEAADKAGVAVIIDLQPGRSDFLSQAKEYEALLKMPNVELALDPEWRLKPTQVPLEQIGSVNSSEVNKVVTWLADLTRDNGLPQKLFVLHQFQNRMIQDRSSIDMSRPELAMLIHADGQGGQPDKQATWEALHVDAPAGIAWGWKNFIDEDHPMLTPKQTMQVRPVPNLITYQ